MTLKVCSKFSKTIHAVKDQNYTGGPLQERTKMDIGQCPQMHCPKKMKGAVLTTSFIALMGPMTSWKHMFFMYLCCTFSAEYLLPSQGESTDCTNRLPVINPLPIFPVHRSASRERGFFFMTMWVSDLGPEVDCHTYCLICCSGLIFM